MRIAMTANPGVCCFLREHRPNVGVGRAFNIFNHLYLGRQGVTQELQHFFANNFLNLPIVDLYRGLKDTFGETAIN
jgi:hypothetical protein